MVSTRGRVVLKEGPVVSKKGRVVSKEGPVASSVKGACCVKEVREGAYGVKEVEAGACGVKTLLLAWVQNLWSGLGIRVQGFGCRV